MSRIFEFDEGDDTKHKDVRNGKLPAVWERKDLNYALGKYETLHGKTKMYSMLRALTGATVASNVPVYMFARVIAHVAREITLRPERVSVMKALPAPSFMRRLTGRKPNVPDEFA